MHQAERLPDFIVIGAMKAGTTRLHHILAAHGDIGVPSIKETDFFVPEICHGRGRAWYARQFPPARILGEVSPNYAKALVFPGVPQRIAKLVPHVRIIYLARDPAARAISEYRHKHAAGLLPADGSLDADMLQRLVDPGLYHRQISAYWKHFAPDQIQVITSEALHMSPDAALTQIAQHLGARDHWPQPGGHSNAGTGSLPGWYWRLRQAAPVRRLRRRLPPALAARIRRAAMRRVPQVALPDGLAERVRDATARDADAFRAATGLATPDWSC